MLNLLSIYLKGTFIFNPVLNDAAEPLQISFQDSASPGLEGIIDLHDSIFFYLIVISVGVFWILGSILINFNSDKSPIIYKYLNHGTLIELVWTIIPALVLIAIAFPSFKLLYMLDEVISPAMTVKVSGHQWYWSYEYSDFIREGNEAIEFDSYMVPESDLELGQLRLLDVDNRLVIPIDTHIRFVVTGTDVLHDFAVPALGIKIDAVPGRLNQTSAIAKRAGIFYGQCSEICGTYHGFMPSVVEGVDTENFLVWLDQANILPLLAITPIFSRGNSINAPIDSFLSISILTISFIISFLFVTFLIDGFHLSKNKTIRILQLSCFIIISIFILYLLYLTVLLSPVECSSNLPGGNIPSGSVISATVSTVTSAADPQTINMTSTVSMNAEGAKLAIDAVTTVSKNIGLGAAMGAVAAGTAKVLANSPIPPVVKVVGVVTGALAAGAIHTGLTSLQQATSTGNNKNSTYTGNDTPPSPSSFSADSPNEEIFILDLDSPVGLLLSSILTLNLISLILVLLLAFILLFKLLFSSHLELKWLDSIVTPYYHSKIKFIFNKLISAIQKTSIINIILVMFVIIVSGMGSVYLLIKFIANFETIVQYYLKSTGR